MRGGDCLRLGFDGIGCGQDLNEAQQLAARGRDRRCRRPAQASTHAAQLALDALSAALSQIKRNSKLMPLRTRPAASPACNPARPLFSPPLANSTAWSRVRNIARMWFLKSAAATADHPRRLLDRQCRADHRRRSPTSSSPPCLTRKKRSSKYSSREPVSWACA